MLMRRTALLLGPLGFLLLLQLPPPGGMEQSAWKVASIGLLMAAWWMTEAVPIPVTALLPIILLPALGVTPVAEATAPYANPIVFLFLGGFLLAQALEQCGLHRRMALSILSAVGTGPARLVGGFMLAAALTSMWVSNTATVVMMLPMALGVIGLTGPEPGGSAGDNLPVALLLGIAYGSSLGGMATLIGTPPNALLAGFMAESYGVRIGFAQWMAFALPLVLAALPICWFLLTRVVFPLSLNEVGGGRAMIARELGSLGPLSRAEAIVGGIAATVALAWVLQPLVEPWLPGLSDTAIAVTGAVLLFVVPVNWRRGEFPLDWSQAERVPWGILLLFGGGLSLAASIQSSGLAGWIGEALAGLTGYPMVLVVAVVTAAVVFLTELTSNTATAAAFLPVVASTAVGLQTHPLVLAIPTALAASCAFMLPVATPPNALVYAGGHVTIRQMMRAGFWLNLLLIGLITLGIFTLGPPVFGVLR